MKHDPIRAFVGEYRWLSNFWPSPVLMPDGLRYPTAEHAYQAYKTLDIVARHEIAAMAQPGEVKRAGRLLVMRPSWDKLKIEVMREVVRSKFLQNLDLKAKLLATDDALLEEGNWWKDRFWGVSPAITGTGENNLGKILMQIREELHR